MNSLFQFNRRRSKRRGKLFFRLMQQALSTPPATYDTMVKRPKPATQPALGKLSERDTQLAAFEYRQAEEIRDAFQRHQVPYLFIGKSGAILLGFPDTTQDADPFLDKAPLPASCARSARSWFPLDRSASPGDGPRQGLRTAQKWPLRFGPAPSPEYAGRFQSLSFRLEPPFSPYAFASSSWPRNSTGTNSRLRSPV